MMRNRLLALCTLGMVVACSAYSSTDDGGGNQPPGTNPGTNPDPTNPHPDAPPTTDTPPESELTEKFGYFVTEQGNDANDGSRAKPLATIGAALQKAKLDGKRVYVCQGNYLESLTLENGVSIIGGYDCSKSEWTNGAKRSAVRAPASPAARAKGIVAATRIERLELHGPDGAESSPSSIVLIAEGSKALTFVNSALIAGNALAGAPGEEGIQLTQTGNAQGKQGISEGNWCRAGEVCRPGPPPVTAYTGVEGGMVTCTGAPGHDGGKGGRGGSPGMWEVKLLAQMVGGPKEPTWVLNNGQLAGEVKTGAAGAAGMDGASATTAGQLTPEGYAPSDGTAGTDGSPGEGGSGANGFKPIEQPANQQGNYWDGNGGDSGGAGGCPGLAGTAGHGGGASIGALLFDSPLTFDRTEVHAGNGGPGGKGTFGSKLTEGGGASGLASPGGAGGRSGISGSGAGGPSYAIAAKGGMPTLSNSTATPGKPGAGVTQQTNADAKQIPASIAGEAKDIFAF